MLKLRIPVGSIAALMGLTVGLEGITHFPKEPRDRDMARLESLPVQFRAKVLRLLQLQRRGDMGSPLT
jgi:hypothetical protein